MRTGMLWFDGDQQRGLAEKVGRAAEHYRRKYGQEPTLCYVHPSMLAGGEASGCEIEVQTANTVLPHHIWIGRKEDGKRRRRAAA
jgi:hypothetical protein